MITQRAVGNEQKRVELDAAWQSLLTEVLRRGFFGSASLEITVQDGTIQHLRRRVEQVVR